MDKKHVGVPPTGVYGAQGNDVTEANPKPALRRLLPALIEKKEEATGLQR